MKRFPFTEIPPTSHYWLTHGRIPSSLLGCSSKNLPPIPELAAAPFQEELVAVDVEIGGGQIRRIAPAGTAPAGATRCHLRQGLIWPCFIDMHTHLDKAHIWPRTANLSGTFAEALEQVDVDRERYWRGADLHRRIDFALRCSYAQGTRAIRTHVDCLEHQAATSFAVLDELRTAWADKINLQFVSLVPIEFFLRDDAADLVALVADYGGILGAVTYQHPELERQIDRAFQLAKAYGLSLDLHVDESLNPQDQALAKVAQGKIRHDFSDTVVCGHVCSLSVQSPATVELTLEQVQAAAITVVSLPLCNLYLQDRVPGRTPRYRGVTLLHELHQAGIPVALAGDNSRDPFFAYGDHDGVEVFPQSVRIGHLDRPYGDWPQAVTTVPAVAMGLAEAGAIQPGQTADLVLFRARTLNELVARNQCDRIVLRGGQAIDTSLPDYAELDDIL